MFRPAIFLSFFLCGAAHAADLGEMTGLYYPSTDKGVFEWSCTADTIGMDGGAIFLGEAQFQAVDNSCDISNRAPAGQSIDATLTCMAEGMPYDRRVRFTPTSDGFTMEDEDGVTSWTRCGI